MRKSIRSIAVSAVLMAGAIAFFLLPDKRVLGQGESNTITIKYSGVPTGNCSFIMHGLNGATGDLYTCPSGSWVLAAIGAGGSTLTRYANACRVTSDITLPVNTATAVCSWSLPATAQSWGWQCMMPWVISAGSGTNTISIGVNASQTPTGTTNVMGEVVTSNAGAAVEATVPLSSSGAVNVVTSGTITPGATVFQANTGGTLLASATAGTFTITMTAAGTTVTAAAKAGATCYLY